MIEKFKKIGLFTGITLLVFFISKLFYNTIFSILARFVYFNFNILKFSLSILSTILIIIIFYTIITKKLKKETINILENIGLFTTLFFIFLYKDIIYLLPFEFLNVDYNSLSYNNQVLCSLGASLTLAVLIFFIYKKYLINKFKDFKKNFNEYFDMGIKLWFIGLIGMSISNFLIGTFTPVHEANNEVLVQEMLKLSPILSFISASFFAPFLEEMLFRKSFGDIFKNKKLMTIASGIVFGLLHVIFSLKTPWDLLYVVPYGFLGSSFAYMLYKKDNIYVPILFHMIHNGVLILISIISMV